MARLIYLFAVVVFASCSHTTYYVVRHAEKEPGAMFNNPPLTTEGGLQAQDLNTFLSGKKIRAVYSTNYVRSLSTAAPTAAAFSLPVTQYSGKDMALFTDSLKALPAGNVLIVGHSNTVDDIVNGLVGHTVLTDLPDSSYGSIFMVKKKGKTYSFSQMRVPKTTPRPRP